MDEPATSSALADPDKPLGGGALPAQDFDGDGVPDVDPPDAGNITDDPGLQP